MEGALCLELSGDPPWEIMVLPMDRSCSVWICSCVKEEEGEQDESFLSHVLVTVEMEFIVPALAV